MKQFIVTIIWVIILVWSFAWAWGYANHNFTDWRHVGTFLTWLILWFAAGVIYIIQSQHHKSGS